MKLGDEFRQFTSNHLLLSVATLGLAPLFGVLGARVVRSIKNSALAGSQATEVAAKNILNSPSKSEQDATASLASKSITKPDPLSEASIRNAAQSVLALEPMGTPEDLHAKFEEELNEWLNDPTTMGNTQVAADRIRDAFTAKSTSLTLAGLNLNSLPKAIGKLTSLVILNLYHNKLTTLPPEIGGLKNLGYLQGQDNQLTTLPREIGALTDLKELNLSQNKLTTLPPQIGQLAVVEDLDFSNNQLRALPPEIGRLTTLRSLTVRDNQLATLPPEIGRLTSLVVMDASDNQITALPPEFENSERFYF